MVNLSEKQRIVSVISSDVALTPKPIVLKKSESRLSEGLVRCESFFVSLEIFYVKKKLINSFCKKEQKLIYLF